MNKWNCFKNPVTNSERFQMVDCFSVVWKASLGTGDVAQLIECLPSMLKILGLIPWHCISLHQQLKHLGSKGGIIRSSGSYLAK